MKKMLMTPKELRRRLEEEENPWNNLGVQGRGISLGFEQQRSLEEE